MMMPQEWSEPLNWRERGTIHLSDKRFTKGVPFKSKVVLKK